VKLEHTDPAITVSRGKAPDETLTIIVAYEIGNDPHLPPRRRAYSMGIAGSIVNHHLTDVLEMKHRHLRSVPCTSSQKATRVDSAKRILPALAKHRPLIFISSSWEMSR
jgi:hypothetical protein